LNASAPKHPNAGLIPCSAMRNHGVAWRLDDIGRCRVWLVTARKPGEEWDWDSDIGHESAHASFAPVPLFAESLGQELENARLAASHGPEDLSFSQLAAICYALTELAVVAVRGEDRPTRTRLPVGEPAELYQLLKLSIGLFPQMGFDRAYAAF